MRRICYQAQARVRSLYRCMHMRGPTHRKQGEANEALHDQAHVGSHVFQIAAARASCVCCCCACFLGGMTSHARAENLAEIEASIFRGVLLSGIPRAPPLIHP